MERMKTTPFISLPVLLLLAACSSVEHGVVVARGHRQNAAVNPPIDYYWVDVRGKNRGGSEVTERVQLFPRDWPRFKKGDRISPHDFDMIGVAKALGASLKKLAHAGVTPPPAPAPPRPAAPKKAARRPAAPAAPPPETEAMRTAKFRAVETRAIEDPAMRELKKQIYKAKTDEDQTAAYREYRKALFQKMRELKPALKERIDEAENARN